MKTIKYKKILSILLFLSFMASYLLLPNTVRIGAAEAGYALATDADFSGTRNGSFRYIGTDKRVEVPHTIKNQKVTSYYGMFEGTSVEAVKSTNKNVTSTSNMFKDNTATSLDVSDLDTSNVTDMSYMFYNCKTTELNVSNFDTSKVTDMSYLFGSLYSVTSLDLSNFDTSNVKSMKSMFLSSKAAKLDLSSFNTSNVTDMSSMFNMCNSTEINISSFDTSNVTDMSSMFAYTYATELDLSGFNTSNVTNMTYMFFNSKVAELDLSNFNTSSVTAMRYTFQNTAARIGWARTKEEAQKLNDTSYKPADLKFNVIDISPPSLNKVWFNKNSNINLSFSHGVKTLITEKKYCWKNDILTPTSWMNYTSPLAQPPNGESYLHYRVKTSKGEEFMGYYGPYKMDKESPTLSIVPSTTGATRYDVELTTSALDILSGIKRIKNPDGVWTNSSNIIYTATKNGVYTFVAEDNAGNIDAKSITISNIDREAPSLTITPSTTNPTHDDILLTVATSDSLSGVKRIKNPDGVWTNSSKVTYTVTKNGAYEFTVEDNAGNTALKSITVNNIDKTTNTLIAPTITNFNSVQIKESIQSIYAKISEIIIKDWTVNTNNWRVSVSASRMTNKNGHTLPEGSLRLQSPTNIKKVSTDGKAGNLSVASQSVFNIDTGNSFEVASGNKSRGEFAINFPENALEISIDPSTARIGTYSSTITWELINAP